MDQLEHRRQAVGAGARTRAFPRFGVAAAAVVLRGVARCERETSGAPQRSEVRVFENSGLVDVVDIEVARHDCRAAARLTHVPRRVRIARRDHGERP